MKLKGGLETARGFSPALDDSWKSSGGVEAPGGLKPARRRCPNRTATVRERTADRHKWIN